MMPPRSRNARRILLSLFVVFSFLFFADYCGFAQVTKQISPQIRQKTFNAVWKTVNDNYFDRGSVVWTGLP